MTAAPRLAAALADRYRIERELVLPGAGFLMIRRRPLDPGGQQLIMLEHWNAGGAR